MDSRVRTKEGQTMRRLLTLWTALGVLAALSGCRHIAGGCDCCFQPCGYGSPLPYTIKGSPPPPPLQPEPIKPMPKEVVPAPTPAPGL
jgi:hypothetical protein